MSSASAIKYVDIGGKDTPLPFISVIVPFYNIEDCVDYCLDSLLDQRGFNSYEIICVDDGSTDGTLAKLEARAENPKIVVLHKENGGLSSARNFGVSHARGRYVNFVDGDDLVSPYYLKFLASGIENNDRTMVIGRHRLVSYGADGKPSLADWTSIARSREVNIRDLFAMYMREELLPGAWSRLIPIEVYKEHPFPEGVTYEEIDTAAVYVMAVDKCILVDAEIYGYVMRPGSIVHRKTSSIKQAEDYLRAIDKFSNLVERYFSAESPENIYFHALHYSRLYRLLDVVVDDDGYRVREIREQIIRYIKAHLKTVLTDRNVSYGNKIRVLLLAFSPRLFRLAFSVYEKIAR